MNGARLRKTKTRPIVSADNHDNFGSRNEELDTGLINLAVLLAAVLSEVSSALTTKDPFKGEVI